MGVLSCRLFERQILTLLINMVWFEYIYKYIFNVGDVDNGLKSIHFKVLQQHCDWEGRRLSIKKYVAEGTLLRILIENFFSLPLFLSWSWNENINNWCHKYVSPATSWDTNGFLLLNSHDNGKCAVSFSIRFQKAPTSADLIDAKGDN